MDPESIDFYDEHIINNKTICNNISNVDNEIITYIRYVFIVFMIIWTFIISINRFYNCLAFPILLIPYLVFGIGFFNSGDIANDKIENSVFSTTFITMGLVISLPLLSYMSGKILGIDSDKTKNEIDPKKQKLCTELNHIIFLAMIVTLLSYIHIWVDESKQHIFKIIKSCFETIAVTLYIFALTIFFILT